MIPFSCYSAVTADGYLLFSPVILWFVFRTALELEEPIQSNLCSTRVPSLHRARNQPSLGSWSLYESKINGIRQVVLIEMCMVFSRNEGLVPFGDTEATCMQRQVHTMAWVAMCWQLPTPVLYVGTTCIKSYSYHFTFGISLSFSWSFQQVW